MRVIGRVLLGTLAIVFAMVLIARLVRRRRAHARRHAHPSLPRALPAPASSLHSPSHHKRPVGYLAAQPGGSGWGRLVVPPSSPSRALRRRGKRRPLSAASAARSLRRAGRGRLPGAAALRLQKTVVGMNYGMPPAKRRPQHGAHEGARLNRTLPRRLRAGASRRAPGAKAVGWLADATGARVSGGAGAGVSASGSRQAVVMGGRAA
jgi:hypothetical protein